ncbi:hypothetical protein [Pedobacter alpinus]|uniref:Uncharacterized protein n=1 Tax=Pedobacter alpinus TaxID=1590643 RepID=A0ABW5TTL6_9SPHI
MNLYINYQFNFGNNIHKQVEGLGAESLDPLLQELEKLLQNVSAASLKETLFKLLMEYMVKHGEPARKDLKEVYILLEFLKQMGEVQAKLLGK